MAGIKETKEALVLGFALAQIIKDLSKDGFQVSDTVACAEKLLSDEVVGKIRAAVEGAGQIPAEAGDVDLFEGLELAKLAIAELKKLAA